MDEAALRLAAVFDEAVAIQVAITIDPGERALDIWPDSFHERPVASARVVCTGQHNEKRRRIDAAVIALERNLAQGGHFILAHFVQHLARLRILLGVIYV